MPPQETKPRDQAKPSEDDKLKGPGKVAMGPRAIVILVSYTVLFMIGIIVTLVILWPPLRPKEVRERLAAEASPTPTPTPSPTPPTTPPATGTAGTASAPPATGAARTAPGALPRQSPTAATNTQPASATATATPTPCPSPRAPDVDCKGVKFCDGVRMKEGFCLDEMNRPIVGMGALQIRGRCWCMYDEDRLLLIVLLAGALGACVHGLRSLSWYVGSRRLYWSWSAMYFVMPFLGAGIAAIFYLVIRGGFFSPTSQVEDMSPYGFAALAAIVGMFTQQAIEKLKKVGSAILEEAPTGKDHVDPPPKITGVAPTLGKAGDKVVITGQGFSTGAKVTFDGVPAKVTESSVTSIAVEAPAHAAGKVDVVVINEDDQQAKAEAAFEYTDSAQAGAEAGARTIASVSPAAGPSAGGAKVTITGTGFLPGPPQPSVDFGEASATITEMDATKIVVTTPAHVAGVVDVMVTNADGTQAVKATGYTYE